MSRKPSKRKRGHRAGAAGSQVVPITRRLGERRLLGDFARWVDTSPDTPDELSGQQLADFLGTLSEATAVSLTSLTAEQIDDVLLDFDAAEADELHDMSAMALSALLAFLASTDRWHGTSDDLTDCLEVIDDHTGGMGVEPEVFDPQVRREALDATVLVQSVPELLSWLGNGRPVTAAGWPRRGDIAELGAMLGLDVVGSAAQGPPIVPPEWGGEPDGQPVRLQTVQDSDEMSAWWFALRRSQVIDVSASRVRRCAGADEWVSDDPDISLAVRESLLAAFVEAYVDGAAANRFGPRYLGDQRAAALVATLAGALQPGMLPLEESGGPISMRDLTRTPMARLVRLGLVAAGDDGEYVVPVGLRGPVADALHVFMPDPDDVDEDT